MLHWLNTAHNEVKVTGEVCGEILDRLRKWEHRAGDLAPWLRFYRELLQIQIEARSRIIVTKPSLSRDLIRDRLRQGIPLLLFQDFSPEWSQVQAVFEEVAVWAAKDSRGPSGENDRLREIGHSHLLLRKAARLWYEGHSLTDIAREQGVDNELLSSAIAATLKPFLLTYARLLLPQVDQELWRRRHCPICGAKPDLAYLDKERGARWLICSHCDAEWLFLRLQCPYCGTQNQDALAFFTDEGDSHLYRLYVCEQCRAYIKAIDLRCAESEILLPLERMLTLDMDRQVQELGYKPGWANHDGVSCGTY